MDRDTISAIVVVGAAGAGIAVSHFFGRPTYKSAKEAFEAGSPTATRQAGDWENAKDWLSLYLAQKQAVGRHYGVQPVAFLSTYRPVLYPNTPYTVAQSTLEGWKREVPIDVGFGGDLNPSARQFIDLKEWLSKQAITSAALGGQQRLLSAAQTERYWDKLFSLVSAISADRVFNPSSWSMLGSSIGEAWREAPQTIASFVVESGLDVAEYAGELAGSAVGGVLGKILGNPIIFGAAAAGLAFAFTRIGVK